MDCSPVQPLVWYCHPFSSGYANFGSDIGGYRSGSGTLGRTKELFIRWAQLGAFSPLMENGGDKEHRPWMFDNTNETLNIYRKLVSVFHVFLHVVYPSIPPSSAGYLQCANMIYPITEPYSFCTLVLWVTNHSVYVCGHQK